MLTRLKYIDFARAKSEAPINKFIIEIKQKGGTYKSVNFREPFIWLVREKLSDVRE